MGGLKPWLKIWVAPRQVLRGIVHTNPNHGFWILCFIYGFLQAVSLFQIFSFGAAYPLVQLIIGALVLAIPFGYVSMNVSAFFLFISGKILQGQGSFKEVRAAYAWSKVPEVVNILMIVLMIVCWGKSLFLDSFNEALSYCFGFLVGRLLLAVQITIGIWGLIILFYALAEVQKFAVWLAIINVVLMTLCYIALFTLLEMLIMQLGSQPVAFIFG